MNADNERRLMRAWLRGGESGSPVSRSRDGQECEGSKSVLSNDDNDSDTCDKMITVTVTTTTMRAMTAATLFCARYVPTPQGTGPI